MQISGIVWTTDHLQRRALALVVLLAACGGTGENAPPIHPSAFGNRTGAVVCRGFAGPVTPSLARGLDDPCALRITLIQEDWRGVELELDHEGPIGPGVYPVAPNRARMGPEDHPGNFVLYFGTRGTHPRSAGREQNYYGESGTVEVTSVEGGRVTGRLVASGGHVRDRSPMESTSASGSRSAT